MSAEDNKENKEQEELNNINLDFQEFNWININQEVSETRNDDFVVDENNSDSTKKDIQEDNKNTEGNSPIQIKIDINLNSENIEQTSFSTDLESFFKKLLSWGVDLQPHSNNTISFSDPEKKQDEKPIDKETEKDDDLNLNIDFNPYKDADFEQAVDSDLESIFPEDSQNNDYNSSNFEENISDKDEDKELNLNIDFNPYQNTNFEEQLEETQQEETLAEQKENAIPYKEENNDTKNVLNNFSNEATSELEEESSQTLDKESEGFNLNVDFNPYKNVNLDEELENNSEESKETESTSFLDHRFEVEEDEKPQAKIPGMPTKKEEENTKKEDTKEKDTEGEINLDYLEKIEKKKEDQKENTAVTNPNEYKNNSAIINPDETSQNKKPQKKDDTVEMAVVASIWGVFVLWIVFFIFSLLTPWGGIAEHPWNTDPPSEEPVHPSPTPPDTTPPEEDIWGFSNEDELELIDSWKNYLEIQIPIVENSEGKDLYSYRIEYTKENFQEWNFQTEDFQNIDNNNQKIKLEWLDPGESYDIRAFPADMESGQLWKESKEFTFNTKDWWFEKDDNIELVDAWKNYLEINIPTVINSQGEEINNYRIKYGQDRNLENQEDYSNIEKNNNNILIEDLEEETTYYIKAEPVDTEKEDIWQASDLFEFSTHKEVQFEDKIDDLRERVSNLLWEVDEDDIGYINSAWRITRNLEDKLNQWEDIQEDVNRVENLLDRVDS